ncbi:sensor histidine kinase [Flavobacterium oncorhynchi]|uniref:sensor histidine kinase n=1 Tax=Flavobacterium oncorhynchi TaxID=728056 RepID=UPI00351A52EE
MLKVFLLDPKTVHQLYFLGNLFICILIFSYSFSYAAYDDRKTLKRFGYGKLLLTIGWILFFLRNLVPDLVSINIANTIIFTACYCEVTALFPLFEIKKIYRLEKIITVTAIFFLNLIVFFGGEINIRIIVMCLGIFSIYLLPVISYFKNRDGNFFRTFYMLCYVVFELLILIRALYNYFNPQYYFFSYSAFDNLYNISLFLLTLIGTVGFLLLVEEKQNLKISKLLKDKNQFFSIIAHDLKGPLGASVQLSEMISKDVEGYSREEIKEILEVIHESNSNIHKLLDNLLEWSQVQTGMIEYTPEKIVLNDLIAENVELNKNAAANKRIIILCESDEFIEVILDRNMISTTVRNLLSNAIKFTDKHGEITINIRKKEQKVLVAITDNGIGISLDIKEKLFKIDTKVVQKGTENEKGNGIGLLLCKEFVKLHHGEIWVESELGKGSTFVFALPL